MNVSAIIVTRGDQDLTPVLASLPEEWEVLIWNNGGIDGRPFVDRYTPEWDRQRPPSNPITYAERHFVSDLSVYGRYAAIEYATDADLIYVQDDDCVVSDPQAIVDAWRFAASPFPQPALEVEGKLTSEARPANDVVVCNMPPEFRHDFYSDHALVGFGACFHRDAPARAFARLNEAYLSLNADGLDQWFSRTCDIVFTALTPRVLVEVPTENLPWAYHYTRMYRQPEHQAERVRMLDLVREIA